MKKNKLGAFHVAFMYVGSIMGAGFASGREIWQFFGVFGGRGYIGIALAGMLFVAMGIMTSRIAIRLGTNDMGKVIVPGNQKRLTAFVGYFMALMLFTVLITMSAAGGSIFQQQFGLSRILGGAVIITMVIVTVLGGFDRIAHVFRYMIPVLILTVLLTSVLVITKDLPASQVPAELEPSPLAAHWILSAILYVSYNVLAVVPIVATASIHAKSERHAVLGGGLGGLFVTLLILVLLIALNTDGNFSQSMDLPVLAYSGRLSPVLNLLYICVLLFAVYGSATSNYYGFTTKLKQSPKKKWLIIIIAWVGFLFGLIGFKNVVAYMFPIEGFMGIVIVLMVMVNFMKTMKKKKSIFEIFGDGYDRFAFPEGIVRVTGGNAGESILITGGEKTALVDCGMAYCGPELVANIQSTLAGRPLDYVLVSHTHYDHIGALPYIRAAFPEVLTYGSKRGQEILQRQGALRTIKELGENARDTYSKKEIEISTEGLTIDRVLSDGEKLSLGGLEVVALETKGHTDCSMTFVLEPLGIMFASESTGILEGAEYVHTPILKSYSDSMKALEKCKAYDPKYIVLPHFGILPPNFNQTYWNLAAESAEEKKTFLMGMKGLEPDVIVARYMDRYWTPEKAQEQPIEAFELNAKLIIRAIMKDL